jgi:hypothetical protein
MGKAEHSPATAHNGPTRAMQNGPWNALSRQPGSGMPMLLRTLREHLFRMRPDLVFRMNRVMMALPLLNRLDTFRFSPPLGV